MNRFEKIDDALYISKYGCPRVGDATLIWQSIKNNKELLEWAIKPVKDKFGEKNIVNGLAICDSILIYYDEVDPLIYQNLVNLIFSDEQIARIVQDGASNGGYSYLLMALWNHDLKLTEEQKQFAVNEAMNKIGTTRYKKQAEEYSRKLELYGINDDVTTTINVDNQSHPIGAKTKNEYMNYLFSSMSDTQAHGSGEFDIRYCILRNPNWSKKEKQKLIMDFWCNDDEYEEFLSAWEWNVVNDAVNYIDELSFQFDYDILYEYTYDNLLKLYTNKNIADRIWSEIQFLKEMRELRPKYYDTSIEPEPHILKYRK